MFRLTSLATLLLAFALGAAPAFAAPEDAPAPKKKPAVTRHVKKWTTPPGYRTPDQIERDRRAEINRSRRAYYRAGGQPIYYWKDPDPRYFRGRWNSGSFGPCWTSTPIGYVWNCGK